MGVFGMKSIKKIKIIFVLLFCLAIYPCCSEQSTSIPQNIELLNSDKTRQIKMISFSTRNPMWGVYINPDEKINKYLKETDVIRVVHLRRRIEIYYQERMSK